MYLFVGKFILIIIKKEKFNNLCKRISIIIPVYNIENDLAFCLDSILNQSYKNWECILIDDGSTDLSGKICDLYVKKDKRFSVYHKNNEGVSSARNYGIEKSKGDFIVFIDGDDWIDKNYLSFFMEKMETDIDIVMCHTILEYPNNSLELFSIKPKYIEFNEKNRKDLILSSISINYSDVMLKKKLGFLNTVWGKMYRTDIIKKYNIKFENFEISEDALFNRKIFYYIKKIKIYDNILYHYRMRDFSAAHSFKKNYLKKYNEYLNVVKEYIKEKYEFKDKFLFAYNSLVIYVLVNIMKNYFYNDKYFEKYRRSTNIKDILSKEPYNMALKDFDKLSIINKECVFVIKCLKYNLFWLLDIYYKLRPKMKKLIIFMNKFKI